MDLMQRQFTDGIEYSVTAVRVSYERLVETLSAHSVTGAGPPDWTWDRMILDAWSIVDWANRLHGFIEEFPNLKRRDSAVESIIRVLQRTRVFRDYMQHLQKDLRANTSSAVWGALTWSNTLSISTAEFGEVLSITPFGPSAVPPSPYAITLLRHSGNLDLSELASAIKTFGERFRRSCETQGWKGNDDRQILRVELWTPPSLL